MPTHNNILFIISMHCSYIVCCFKWFRLAVNDLITHQLQKNHSENDYNDFILLCHYRYSCGVDAILI